MLLIKISLRNTFFTMSLTHKFDWLWNTNTSLIRTNIRIKTIFPTSKIEIRNRLTAIKRNASN